MITEQPCLSDPLSLKEETEEENDYSMNSVFH